jgi:hypothetical protein
MAAALSVLACGSRAQEPHRRKVGIFIRVYQVTAPQVHNAPSAVLETVFINRSEFCGILEGQIRPRVDQLRADSLVFRILQSKFCSVLQLLPNILKKRAGSRPAPEAARRAHWRYFQLPPCVVPPSISIAPPLCPVR